MCIFTSNNSYVYTYVLAMSIHYYIQSFSFSLDDEQSVKAHYGAGSDHESSSSEGEQMLSCSYIFASWHGVYL